MGHTVKFIGPEKSMYSGKRCTKAQERKVNTLIKNMEYKGTAGKHVFTSSDGLRVQLWTTMWAVYNA